MLDPLESRYRDFHRQAKLPLPLARRASPPLLVYPHSRWRNAKVRLLIVGKETLTWRYDPMETYGGRGEPILNFNQFVAAPNGVETMFELYRRYALGRYQPKMNSPFWRGFRALDSGRERESGFCSLDECIQGKRAGVRYEEPYTSGNRDPPQSATWAVAP